MPAERWEEVKRLFQAMVELPRSEHEAFLDHACGADEELRREVKSLLWSNGDLSASLLEEPAVAAFSAPVASPQRLGPYRLLRDIGHGGMGTVYLAYRDDDEFQKLVAVKLMRGGVRSEFLLRRFRNERQFLATLEHPNIARLLDGGTTDDGVPYLVMEFVEGEPIHRYGERLQLSVRQRLELFITVCDAVEYAHRNLIVHRDLKPANILINEDGQPKLLDFGIAKLLTSETIDELQTATELRLMTPEYASPEQIRGERISTATDIYSLGVLLYELLTDRRPFELRGRSQHDLIREICDRQPTAPSATIEKDDERWYRALRGDLDNIVLHALRKEPERRYASVAQLAEDVRAYLEMRPIVARRPTAWYRASRFIARHKLAVSATGLALVALLAALLIALWQASVAHAERLRAEEQAAIAKSRFDDVRALANAFFFDIYEEIERLPGSLEVRQKVAARALQHLDRLTAQAGEQPALLADIANAYEKLGSITYGVEATERTHRKAVTINEWLVAREPENARYRQQLSTSLAWLGNVLKLKGDQKGELASYERALALAESLLAAQPSNRDYLVQVQQIAGDTGRAHAAQGNVGEALAHQRRTLEIARAMLAADPAGSETRRNVVIALHLLGSTLVDAGRFDEALPLYDEAITTATALAGAAPADNRYRRDLWFLNRNLGTIHSHRGEHARALSHLRVALAWMAQLIAADPTDGGHRRGLAITHLALGRALERSGDRLGARREYEAALQVGEPLLLDDPKNQETWDDIRDEYGALQLLLASHAAPAEHRAAIEREARLYRQVLARDPANANARAALARTGS